MPFHPDIVVTEAGSFRPLLIVEAKFGAKTADVEAQFRNYIWEMSCPVGLLVSPSEIALFRNLYTGYSNDSVERVGVFSAPPSWTSYGGRGSELEFEDRVQSWLEGLVTRPTELSKDATEAFEQWVVPSLLNGEVHAAGPRLGR